MHSGLTAASLIWPRVLHVLTNMFLFRSCLCENIVINDKIAADSTWSLQGGADMLHMFISSQSRPCAQQRSDQQKPWIDVNVNP